MQRRHRHRIQAGSGTQLQKPLLWILEKFYQRMVSDEPVYKAAETVRDRVQKGGHVDCHSVFTAYCTLYVYTIELRAVYHLHGGRHAQKIQQLYL